MSTVWHEPGGVPDPLDVPVATEPVQRADSLNDGCLLPIRTPHKDTDVFL